MSKAIDEHRNKYIQMYRKDFANHILTLEGDGRWLCHRESTSNYYFRVIAAPGAILLYGDIGEQIIRVNERDAVAWLRGVLGKATISYDYFAEKCVWKERQFLSGLAEELLNEHAAGDDDPEPPAEETYDHERWQQRQTERETLVEEVREAVSMADDDAAKERAFRSTWYEATGDPEMPDPTDWDSHIFLFSEALRRFVELLP